MRPNILLFMCDQLRAFSVGCYGDDTACTPNIDRLAATGTRFATAVSNTPLCSPARAIALSGQYARTCTGSLGNMDRNPANPKRVRMLSPTLAEVLQQAGYATALIGKWHLDPQPQLLGFDHAVYPDFEHRNYRQRYWDEAGCSRVVDGFGPDFELAEFKAFLDRRGGEPFFGYYNIGLPHQPIGPGHLPESHRGLCPPASVPLRPNVPADIDDNDNSEYYNTYTSSSYYWRSLTGARQDPADLVPDDFGIRDLTALYLTATALVDDYFGRVIAALQKRGLDSNTIVMFVSDHGDILGSHGRFGKNTLDEEALRIPLVIREPRTPFGRTVNDCVASLVDIMPTLLDLAGLDIPPSVQGTSLAAAVRGNNAEELPQQAFIESHDAVGIRTPRHKLSVGSDAAERVLDFGRTDGRDLSDDPYEMADLDSCALPDEVLKNLQARIISWDRETPWLDAPPPLSIWDYLPQSCWTRASEDRKRS